MDDPSTAIGIMVLRAAATATGQAWTTTVSTGGLQYGKCKAECWNHVRYVHTYICYTPYFGEVFNLVNWQFCRKLPNLKPTNIISYTIAPYGSARNRQIKNSPMHSDYWFAKFNIHQSFPLYSIYVCIVCVIYIICMSVYHWNVMIATLISLQLTMCSTYNRI